MKNKFQYILPSILLFLLAGSNSTSQQVGDSTYTPVVLNPIFEAEQGPVVFIDEAHNNFHTVEGRYAVFAALLRKDGYIVKPSRQKFMEEHLKNCNILVIANALAEQNIKNWDKPHFSAFSDDEVKAVNQWVKNGGSLMLIADHMPFPKAAENLALSFGVEFDNGYALTPDSKRSVLVFRRTDNSLLDHPIINGFLKSNTENKSNSKWAKPVDSVATFTGQAFKAYEFTPLLQFPAGYVTFNPEKSWDLSETVPTTDITGWLQAGVKQWDKGRIAVFGEAAMFTAQKSGQFGNMGLNHPSAKQNVQLIRNLLYWLSDNYK